VVVRAAAVSSFLPGSRWVAAVHYFLRLEVSPVVEVLFRPGPDERVVKGGF